MIDLEASYKSIIHNDCLNTLLPFSYDSDSDDDLYPVSTGEESGNFISLCYWASLISLIIIITFSKSGDQST